MYYTHITITFIIIKNIKRTLHTIKTTVDHHFSFDQAQINSVFIKLKSIQFWSSSIISLSAWLKSIKISLIGSFLVHFSCSFSVDLSSALFSSVKFNSISRKSRSKVFWSIILHINHILHKLILITSNTSLVTGITSTSGLSPGCNE